MLDTGVIDQNIDRPAGSDGLIDQRLAVGRLREVGLDEITADPLGLLLAGRFVNVGQHHPIIGLDQGFGNGEADAAGSPGDQGNTLTHLSFSLIRFRRP